MSISAEEALQLQARVQAKGAPVRQGETPPVKARGTTPRVRNMNKAERAYAAHLAHEMAAGRILDHKFEAVKLRLADNTSITMDFLVIAHDGAVEFRDVKALWRSTGKMHAEDDYLVKVKVAADLYPYFTFITTWNEAGVWRTRRH